MTSAMTSSIPKTFATDSAVFLLSPVNKTVFKPSSCKRSIATFESERIGSEIPNSANNSPFFGKEGKYVILRLPSGEMRYIFGECMATIGTVGNADYQNITIGKAGRSRWLGIRPQTRGVAMNPVDHPHGGGEGRSKGNHPVSPWGMPTKGYKTRKKKQSDKYIISRRKK